MDVDSITSNLTEAENFPSTSKHYTSANRQNLTGKTNISLKANMYVGTNYFINRFIYPMYAYSGRILHLAVTIIRFGISPNIYLSATALLISG